MAVESRMIALGFGKFARSDRIFALEPLLGEDRGDGRRTRVWVEGIVEPIIAARTENTILRDMGQEQAVDATIVDEALDLASRLAKAADIGRVDLSDLGRPARVLDAFEHQVGQSDAQGRQPFGLARAQPLVDQPAALDELPEPVADAGVVLLGASATTDRACDHHPLAGSQQGAVGGGAQRVRSSHGRSHLSRRPRVRRRRPHGLNVQVRWWGRGGRMSTKELVRSGRDARELAPLVPLALVTGIAPLATALQFAHLIYLAGGAFVGIAFQPFVYMLVGAQIGLDTYLARKRREAAWRPMRAAAQPPALATTLGEATA